MNEFLSNNEPFFLNTMKLDSIQCSASEAIFYSMVWAREDAVRQLRAKFPTKQEDPENGKTRAELLNMLVAYCNNECHCCVERAAMMGCVRMRKLKADKNGGTYM